MPHAIVIGDGPGGLSAGLFLAKNEVEVLVVGGDETPMHYAMLHNFLGVPATPGSAFQDVARAQVAEAGAALVAASADQLRVEGEGFVVELDGVSHTTDYVILAAGKAGGSLARQVGVETTDGSVSVDRDQRTSVDRVYALGRLVRPARSQAIISAGEGAVAALDILSRLAREDVHDWDSVEH